MNKRFPKHALLRGLRVALAGLLLWASPASAEFSAAVSPPRFELKVAPGGKVQEVVEIRHVGRGRGLYRFYTNDWQLDANYAAVFSDALAPDSCRPWVTIERRELALAPGASHRYRFVVEAPADARPRECRFALMIEGVEPARVDGALSLAVSGRIGVIVYVRVGEARPALRLLDVRAESTPGGPKVVLDLANDGDAHTRLTGFVEALDADGRRFEFEPEDAPILPGMRRSVALRPAQAEGAAAPAQPRFPVRLRGSLEWERSKLPVEATVAPRLL